LLDTISATFPTYSYIAANKYFEEMATIDERSDGLDSLISEVKTVGRSSLHAHDMGLGEIVSHHPPQLSKVLEALHVAVDQMVQHTGEKYILQRNGAISYIYLGGSCQVEH